jgi:hypothetical protein
MESLVVALETANKLKAAGWEQGSTAATWCRRGERYQWEVSFVAIPVLEWIAAPSVQEIADQLPELPGWNISLFKSSRWEAYYDGHEYGEEAVKHYCEADTMAEALALLWLKLQEAK